MVKYFCDRCGNELSPYEYDNAAQVTITDQCDNNIKIYHVCSNCEFAIRHFVTHNGFKAGESNE